MTNILVMLIDDDPLMPQILKPIFDVAGMGFISITSEGNILDKVQRSSPDVILIEVILKNKDGLNIVEVLRQELRYTKPMIAISNRQSSDVLTRIRQSTLFNGYLPKPLDPMGLAGYLRYKIENSKNPWSSTTKI